MLYIGSTLIPSLRFHNHLSTGINSNANLQAAIKVHGVSNLTVYILVVVEFPSNLTTDASKKQYLRQIEQKYMDKYPKAQLYKEQRSPKV